MRKTVCLAALLAFSVPALAGDFYVVGSLGRAKIDMDKSALDNELIDLGVTGLRSSLDRKDTAYKALLGYQFNPYLGVEGGYVNLGKAKYSATANEGVLSATAKAKGWTIAGVGTIPVNDSFSAFVKLGAIYAKVDAGATASSPDYGSFAASESASKWKTAYGFGATYHFNKQVGIRVEYEQFKNLGDEDKTGESDVDLISAGLVFKF